MAKLKATELAEHAALKGMQMMGGYGYAAEYDMERHLRTAVVSTAYGGTSEAQRDIIGRSHGLGHRPRPGGGSESEQSDVGGPLISRFRPAALNDR